MSSVVYLIAMLLSVTATPAQSNSGLPVVDLGYVLQRVTTFNHTSNIYDFSNIRYAQPPTRELRFQAPRSPTTDRKIQVGEDGHICYQATLNWFKPVPDVTPQLMSGKVNSTYVNASEHATPLSPAQMPLPIPHEPEDCLFLNVHIPEKAFSSRRNDDDSHYDPAGLLAQSVLQTGKEVIFVALNYRSAGPSLQSDGTANAGLRDQRFALEWIQKNIKSFGGVPKKVTLLGESGGAGSIFGHLTSYGGGHGPVPFQQSLTQSSMGFASAPFNPFFRLRKSLLFEKRLPCHRKSYEWRTKSRFRAFTLVVDGTYVPNQPIRLLLDGNFNKDVHIMQGHNTNEGLTYIPPYAQTTSDYDTIVSTLLNSTDVSQITQTLYPPIFDNNYGYKNNIQRAALTRAVHNRTYNYLSAILPAILPAIHTGDLNYDFYTRPTQPHDPDAKKAVQPQRWISSFAVEGRAAAMGMQVFREYGREGMVQMLALVGVGREVDKAVAGRCEVWFGGGL